VDEAPRVGLERAVEVGRELARGRGRVVEGLAGEAAQQGGLVGQADAGERAAVAARVVDERRRQDGGGRDRAGAPDGLARDRVERGVEVDADLAAVLGEPEHAVGHVEAVLAEQEDLHGDLNALRQVRAVVDRGGAALLVLDGDDAIALPFDDVDLRRDAERLRRQPHAAGGDGAAVVDVVVVGRGLPRAAARAGGRGERAWAVDALVAQRALDGVSVVGELGLRPLEVHEPLTVDRLGDHAPWHERRRVAAQDGLGRGGQAQVLGARRRGVAGT
jgi:hypothetical protein